MPYKLAAGGQDHSITTSVINSLLNDSVLKGGSDLSTLGSLGDEIDNLNTKDINSIIDQIPTQALAGGFDTISEVPTELLLGSDLDIENLIGGEGDPDSVMDFPEDVAPPVPQLVNPNEMIVPQDDEEDELGGGVNNNQLPADPNPAREDYYLPPDPTPPGQLPIPMLLSNDERCRYHPMIRLSTHSGTIGHWNCPWCGNNMGAVNVAFLRDDAPVDGSQYAYHPLIAPFLANNNLVGGDLETSFGDLYSDADSFDMDLESTDSDLFSLYENGLSGGDNGELDLSSSMISELESLYPGI